MITKKLIRPPRAGKVGSNLQNVEKYLRRIYLSDGWDPNNKDETEKLKHYLLTRDLSIFTDEERSRIKIMAQVDQSGAEALIVSYICRYGNFRQLFLHGIKPHTYVGMFVFADVWKKEMESSGTDIKCDIDELCRTPICDVTKNPFWKQLDKLIKSSDKWPSERRYYYIAKQICHCLTPDHEVFDGCSWVPISDMPKKIQVFSLLDYSLKLESVTWNKFPYLGDVYAFHGLNVSQKVTREHKVPHWNLVNGMPLVSLQEAKFLNERTSHCFLLGKDGSKLESENYSTYYEGMVYCPTTSTGLFPIRRNGKVSITGNSSNYGIKAGMFQLNTLEKSKGRIVISKQEAERYLSIYHGLFPEIHQWHRELEVQLNTYRTLFNLFGFPRYFWFPSVDAPETLLKEAFAFPAQSTVGTITNIAFSRLYEYIEDKKLNWDLLQNNHDSYMTQCPIGEEQELIRVKSEFINQKLRAPSDGTYFNMKSEYQVGFNWSPYLADKNPLGLMDS
jgi:hypothetical protein